MVGADGYSLDVSSSSTFSSFLPGYEGLDVGTALSRSIESLSAGTTYYYRLKAHNGTGVSPVSNTIATTTTEAPLPQGPSTGKILIHN